MKKIIYCIITLFCVLSGAFAQNQFVYINYDPQAGNPIAIVDMIEKLQRERKHKQVVIFLSANDRPFIAKTPGEWADLRGELLTMQSAPEFYAQNDVKKVSALFDELFSEHVDESEMYIYGDNDDDWICHFIVPQSMLESPNMDGVFEIIAINELVHRTRVSVLTYDQLEDVHYIKTFPPAKFIDYGLTMQDRQTKTTKPTNAKTTGDDLEDEDVFE